MQSVDLIKLAPDVLYILMLGIILRLFFNRISSLEKGQNQTNTEVALMKKDVSYIKEAIDEVKHRE